MRRLRPPSRFDWMPKYPPHIVQTPTGDIYELDVWLSAEEIAIVSGGAMLPSEQRIYEPWLRITDSVDETVTRAGIDVVTEDDGA